MSKIWMAVFAALLMAGTVGCATTKSNNYQAYLDSVEKIESNKAVAAEAGRMNSAATYAAMMEKCTTDACATSVAAFRAIADTVAALSDGGNSRGNGIAAPPREPSIGEQALAWAGVIVPGITQWSSIVQSNKTQRHLSDNSANVSISQNETWAGIIDSQGTAWSGALGSVAATPSINVGGNYGDTSTAGTSLTSGDDNMVGDGNGNSGRYNSAGPYDSSGDCRDGGSCSDGGGF